MMVHLYDYDVPLADPATGMPSLRDAPRRAKEEAERRIAANHDATAEGDLAKALTRISMRG